MKTHKYSIIFFFGVSMVTLVFLVLSAEVWEDLTAASTLAGVFSSACLSLMISLYSYSTSLKEKASWLVVNAYLRNSECFASLFKANKDFSLEEAQIVISAFNTKTYALYVENHNLLNSLFCHKQAEQIFDKDIKLVKKIKLAKQIEETLEGQIIEISKISLYIERLCSHAKNETKEIYKRLDALIDDNKVFIDLLDLSKLFKLGFSSLEEIEQKEKLKDLFAESFRDSLE